MKKRPYAVFAQVFLAGATVAALALGPHAAFANPNMHGGHGGDGGRHGGPPDASAMLESRIGRLGLDDETRNAVYAIIDGSKSAERETNDRLRQEHETLRTLLEKENPDEGAVLGAAERIGSLTTELRKHQLRTLIAVRAQLTPEQRTQLRPSGFHHGCSGTSGSKSEK